MWYLFGFVINTFFATVLTKNEQYAGYKVYKIKFDSQEQQKHFSLIQHEDIDYWRTPSFVNDVTGLAMVPPSYIDWFDEKLQMLEINKKVSVEDVSEYLNEKENILKAKDVNRQFDYNNYYRYDEILDHIQSLQQVQNESNINIDVIEYGRTFENRPLVYIKISSSTTEKPVVVIEAGINPREWITVPAALNIVDKILDQNITYYIDNFDWIIIPVLNPDGYEFSHTDARLWTKTLSTYSHTGFICPGANINRNFDVNWQRFDSSSSPCSHLYAGVEPFSEIESRLVRSIIQEYSSRIRLYISLQNQGGIISYPWFYEFAASGLFIQHHMSGLGMANAMGNYDLGIGSNNFGRISGTSADFAQNSGVLYSYNIDIEDRDDSVLIPATEIAGIVEDVWRGVSVAVNSLT